MTATPSVATTERCCAVLELRQYTMQPGQRDVLINLFEREFVEGQEAVGMRIGGQFRDAQRADRFVWIRGFRDMPARGEALNAFYGGPVWQAHRGVANPTMIDAANVLLLRPISTGSGFAHTGVRAPIGATALPASRVKATIYYLNAPADAEFIRFFEQQIKPVMAESGAPSIAAFQTEAAENNFPKLAIRTGEHVLVWFSLFASEAQYVAHEQRISQSRSWNDKVLPELRKYLKSPPEHLRLEPTARSLLR